MGTIVMTTMMITIVIGYRSSILSGDPVMVGDAEMTDVEMTLITLKCMTYAL